jgi:cation diffusion facilitator family transporter
MSSSSRSLQRYIWLSICASLVIIVIKAGAYFVTGSVGLMSDALESIVNLISAIIALTMLKISARPPDQEHRYGHDKVEYFSSGAEGAMIMIAAVGIAATAVVRLLHPIVIQKLDIGIALSTAASIINLVVAQVLIRVGRRRRSIVLEADGLHLMTDVWTSVGVIAGIAIVAFTHWQPLDPLLALAVAANITWSGVLLIRRSMLGLMDTALPASDLQTIIAILDRYRAEGVQYHALRTRQSGSRGFVSVHIQAPGSWTVQQGHDLLEAVEADIRKIRPSTTVFTHMEPIEDPASWSDEALDRFDPMDEARVITPS